MEAKPADAQVLLGATGDLAFKDLDPAPREMMRHAPLDVPVIGVARAGWDPERFRARALACVERGTLGRCENCGREISRERLEALPWARDCIRMCAQSPGRRQLVKRELSVDRSGRAHGERPSCPRRS